MGAAGLFATIILGGMIAYVLIVATAALSDVHGRRRKRYVDRRVQHDIRMNRRYREIADASAAYHADLKRNRESMRSIEGDNYLTDAMIAAARRQDVELYDRLAEIRATHPNRYEAAVAALSTIDHDRLPTPIPASLTPDEGWIAGYTMPAPKRRVPPKTPPSSTIKATASYWSHLSRPCVEDMRALGGFEEPRTPTITRTLTDDGVTFTIPPGMILTGPTPTSPAILSYGDQCVDAATAYAARAAGASYSDVAKLAVRVDDRVDLIPNPDMILGNPEPWAVERSERKARERARDVREFDRAWAKYTAAPCDCSPTREYTGGSPDPVALIHEYGCPANG